MSEHWVQIHGKDGSFQAYVAKPAAAPLGAVVVIQEIFGVNPNIRGVADRLAEAGFLAVAPDLFWRHGAGIMLDPDVQEELQQAFDLFGKFDVDLGVEDIQATIAYTRETLGAANVGAVGYCLGGLLAYLTASRTDSDATVGYYGVGIEARLAEADKLTKPLMLHIAEADGFVPPAAQTLIQQGLGNNPQVTLHSYPGRDHAFARIGGGGFDAGASELANARTLGFFFRHLRQ